MTDLLQDYGLLILFGIIAAQAAGVAGLPGWTMGVCTTTGGIGWASERHLTLKQCREVGGSFAFGDAK